MGPDDPRRFTDSGIEIGRLYTEADLPAELDLGEPGEFPYTRGVHREMYRKQTWTMRQYAGYASAKESNERYRYLLSKGSTGLSMAFDLPTQLGLDSDNPRCLGEVGRTGVAIDTIDDMRTAFDGIPLDQVSTSMTINAPAACLLLLYELVGEEQGVPSEKLRGTTQNDVLKEYIARGNYIYPPGPTMRLTTDLFEYCHERVPRWNTISISGYHFREKGCSAVQEVAFTLSLGNRLCAGRDRQGPRRRRLRPAAGVLLQRPQQRLPGGRQVPRRAAHVGAHHDASASERPTRRRRCCASTPRPAASRSPPSSRRTTSCASRCRASRRCAAAPSRCTPTASTRRSRCPPSAPRKSRCAPSRSSPTSPGAADTVDPFAGSYFVEALTDEIEARAGRLIAKVDELGGSVNAIEFITGEIDESAWGYQERYRIGQDIVVGVNAYEEDEIEVPELLRVDPESEREQLERLAALQGRARPASSSRAGSRSCARSRAAARTCSPRSARR